MFSLCSYLFFSSSVAQTFTGPQYHPTKKRHMKTSKLQPASLATDKQGVKESEACWLTNLPAQHHSLLSTDRQGNVPGPTRRLKRRPVSRGWAAHLSYSSAKECQLSDANCGGGAEGGREWKM